MIRLRVYSRGYFVENGSYKASEDYSSISALICAIQKQNFYEDILLIPCSIEWLNINSKILYEYDAFDDLIEDMFTNKIEELL